jgi:hypothetical protein
LFITLPLSHIGISLFLFISFFARKIERRQAAKWSVQIAPENSFSPLRNRHQFLSLSVMTYFARASLAPFASRERNFLLTGTVKTTAQTAISFRPVQNFVR